MVKVPLTRGYVAIVDDCDAERVLPHSWRVDMAHNSLRYARASLGRRSDGDRRDVQLHRFILDAPADVLVDHRNHDGLDNRRSNLRLATASENSSNRRSLPGATSAFLGVTWHRQAQRWQAAIKKDRRSKYLGLYESEIAAARAYDAAAQHIHGEFAQLNFPEAAA